MYCSAAYDAFASGSRPLHHHRNAGCCGHGSFRPNAAASGVTFASVFLFFIFMLLSVNGWWPSPMAQTGWREKVRTRTDAERIMGLHIKPLLFLWRCAVTKTRAA